MDVAEEPTWTYSRRVRESFLVRRPIATNDPGTKKRRGRAAAFWVGEIPRTSERITRDQLVDRTGGLGFELVFVVVAVDLVGRIVELVEELVLLGVEQV